MLRAESAWRFTAMTRASNTICELRREEMFQSCV
jgi:hypothetical protein